MMERNRSRIEMPDPAMVKVLREKTGRERLEIGFSMWRFARQIVHAAARDQHPDWPEDQVMQAAARRMSGGAL